MFLEIDQGNTRLKWRFHDLAMQAGNLDHLEHQLKKRTIRLVRLVSVCAQQRRQHLINSLIFSTPQPLQWCIAQSRAESMGVRNAYQNPQQLGADRWSAVVAAATEQHQENTATVVMGCGSALTVDIIDQHRQHLGGCIAPGFAGLQHGLRYTTDIQFDQLSPQAKQEHEPATNTLGSIEWGVHTMLAGFVQQVTDYCNERFGKQWQLIVHGGDSALLASCVSKDIDASFCPELVLDGLKYIADDSTISEQCK